MAFEKTGSPEKITEVVEQQDVFEVICKHCKNKIGKFYKSFSGEGLISGTPSDPNNISTCTLWRCEMCKNNNLVDVVKEEKCSSNPVN